MSKIFFKTNLFKINNRKDNIIDKEINYNVIMHKDEIETPNSNTYRIDQYFINNNTNYLKRYSIKNP